MSFAPVHPDETDKHLHILHLEDSEVDHQLVVRALQKDPRPFSIMRVDALEDFQEQTRTRKFHVIVADYRLPGFTALDAWHALQDMEHCPPFILLSGAIGESAAVAAIQLGISDYLPKDDVRNLRRVIDRAIAVVEAKAAQARAALELAQSEQRLAQFAQHLQNAIENERAAIAREIHDDIGGSLAAVKLDLSWVARQPLTEPVQSHLASAGDMLQHAIGASQRIMMNLRPAILDQGLVPAIEWLAQGFQRRTGVRTSFSTNHDRLQASKAVELTAYRTAQEALTNISKYAECSAVRIELSDAEGVLTLEVSDNGRGIDNDALQKSSAYGIRGLKERAKVVGGWMDIISGTGQGTTVILSIPLASDEPGTLEADFR
ncbi:ATP-binding protein [Rhodoferax sp.]|jgi:signal transduction histidine kinase|uniref:hybrid sensor histidine kinase/response regulator n=1 Tax=Rhodoferax sp. TaxID=50421 RepID=UPI00378309EB